MSAPGVPRGEVWLPDIGPAGEWVRRAACTDHAHPEWWFAEPGGGGGYAKAAEVCAACPVRSDCLAYALKWRIGFGLWGGLNPGRRQRLAGRLPRARRPAPGHGNPGRYRYGCRCDECREAHRVEVAGYREAARERVS